MVSPNVSVEGLTMTKPEWRNKKKMLGLAHDSTAQQLDGAFSFVKKFEAKVSEKESTFSLFWTPFSSPLIVNKKM